MEVPFKGLPYLLRLPYPYPFHGRRCRWTFKSPTDRLNPEKGYSNCDSASCDRVSLATPNSVLVDNLVSFLSSFLRHIWYSLCIVAPLSSLSVPPFLRCHEGVLDVVKAQARRRSAQGSGGGDATEGVLDWLNQNLESKVRRKR